MTFPSQHWVKLHPTNPLERLSDPGRPKMSSHPCFVLAASPLDQEEAQRKAIRCCGLVDQRSEPGADLSRLRAGVIDHRQIGLSQTVRHPID